MKISVAILAGGQSRRFDGDKTLVKLKDQPLISYITKTARLLSDDVMLISKDTAKYNFLGTGINYLEDRSEQQAPLVGIVTALENAKYDNVLILSADTPLYKQEIVPILKINMGQNEAVLPVIHEKIQPLSGIYSKQVLPFLIGCLRNNKLKLYDIAYEMETKFLIESFFEKVDPKLVSFLNVNTAEDFKKCEAEM